MTNIAWIFDSQIAAALATQIHYTAYIGPLMSCVGLQALENTHLIHYCFDVHDDYCIGCAIAKPVTFLLLYIHWAQEETYHFLRGNWQQKSWKDKSERIMNSDKQTIDKR